MEPEGEHEPTRIPTEQRAEDEAAFPIVGIGASAGGLSAFQGFLARMPADSRMAFVIVSHHQAGQQSLLPELLGHATKMPVEEAREGVRIEPDHVYVAPPGRNVALAGGRLRLLTPAAPRGFPLPIDSFLRSLALDAGSRAVAIILSGTGSDGTLGVQAVKRESGLVIVQDEPSAEFSGMPESAAATGLADFVLPPEQMPERLLAWSRSPDLQGVGARESVATATAHEEIAHILGVLRSKTGHDFSGHKPSNLDRRIQRRQTLHQLDSPRDYVRFLEANEEEVQALFQDLLIGVTGFFRDSGAFEALEAPLFELLAAKPDHAVLRLWIPGCATGEEAYSLAMLLVECIERLGKPLDVQIFATDLDPQAIETARQGRYPEAGVADVSGERLERFFVRRDGGYEVKEEIRSLLVFAIHDILADPPFTRMDIVSCRNLLIYLGAEFQRRVLVLLHYALNPEGLLLLGSSESTTSVDDLFTPLDRRWKLHRRREAAPGEMRVPDFPRTWRGARRWQPPAPRRSASESAASVLARAYAPPSVLVTDRADIVHVHGRTGSFLEPAEGRASMSLLEMAREGLRPALTSLLREAERAPQQPACRDARFRVNGDSRKVRLVARKLAPPDARPGLILVSFEEPPGPAEAGLESRRGEARREAHVSDSEGSSLARELERTQRELQVVIEELQSTTEELSSSSDEAQSTREDLQSANQELQSANEELQTSREEMQSLNEELQTVNAELRAKVTELSQASDDLLNLLSSTSVATLFLDRELRIKRFTPDIAAIVPLKPSDLGRPIADLAVRVDHDRLVEDAAEVLRTLVPQEMEIRSDDDETVYLLRIGPYRTGQNVIDGVVLTFVDITQLKQLEAMNEIARTHAEAIVETVRQPLVTLDGSFRVRSANPAFCALFQTSAMAIQSCQIFDLPGAGWDVLALRKLLEEVIPSDGVVEQYELACDFPTTGRRTIRVDARRMPVQGGQPALILLAISFDPGAGRGET
jgi:two-component system CheB/CheR fusion protein